MDYSSSIWSRNLLGPEFDHLLSLTHLLRRIQQKWLELMSRAFLVFTNNKGCISNIAAKAFMLKAKKLQRMECAFFSSFLHLNLGQKERLPPVFKWDVDPNGFLIFSCHGLFNNFVVVDDIIQLNHHKERESYSF